MRRIRESLRPVRESLRPVRNSLYEIRNSILDIGARIKERRIVRNALLASVLGGGAMLALATQREWFVARSAPASHSAEVVAPRPPPPAHVPKREPLMLTEIEKAKGFWECILPDPGNGIYAPMRTIPMGHVMIPKSGGHTDDFGYDVIVHFHGFPSIRKQLATTARGVVLAGFDFGNGSGAYNDAVSPLVFEKIKEGIVAALKSYSGDERAHIRHLALSAWSAGFAGVNKSLRNGDDGVDAVILLDGFHTAYLNQKENELSSLDTAGIAPLLSFAEKATKGEKFFYFTHSSVETRGYASTTKVSNLLVERFHLTLTKEDPGNDPLGLIDFVDEKGFHMRGFAGMNEKAHCDQLRNVTEAVRDFLEPEWGTPPAEGAPPEAAASASEPVASAPAEVVAAPSPAASDVVPAASAPLEHLPTAPATFR